MILTPKVFVALRLAVRRREILDARDRSRHVFVRFRHIAPPPAGQRYRLDLAS